MNTKITKILFLVVAFVMAFAINAQAAVNSIYYNATDYQNANSDLKRVYNGNETLLAQHWNAIGKAEGRSPSKYYVPSEYLANNPDLRKVFVSNGKVDYVGLYNHFVACGLKEGRAGSVAFDPQAYIDNNSDLKKAYTTSDGKVNYEAAYNHYATIGEKEGRTAVEKHETVKVEAKAATCKEEGNVEYYTCKTCSKLFADAAATKQVTKKDVILAITEHDYVKVAMTATCQKEGTYYNRCSVCGSEEMTTNANGDEVVKVYTGKMDHNYSLLTATVEATCGNPGYKLYTCSTCGEATQTSEISDALTHNKLKKTAAKAATCTENGNIEYWYCDDCGNYYLNEEAKTAVEYDDTIKVPAKGHTYASIVTVEATCDTPGTKVPTCTVCGYTNTPEPISATGHNFSAVVEEKDSTCSVQGNYDYTVCSNCNQYYKAATKDASNADVTSTTPGAVKIGSKYYLLTLSDKDSVKKALISHTYNTTVIPATATSCEKTVKICKDCGDRVETSAHTKGSLSAAATCETAAKYICSKCGAKFDADDEPALGHSWTVVTPATCTANAVLKCTRTNCKYNTTAGTSLDNLLAAEAITDSAATAYKATGHTVSIIPAATVNCETDGIKANTYQCASCDAYFTTVDSKGIAVLSTTAGAVKIGPTYYLPITEAAVKTSKTGHNYTSEVTSEATCDTTGVITYTCDNENCPTPTKTETIPAKGHTLTKVAAKAATCSEKGNAEYYVCNACKKYFVKDANGTVTVKGEKYTEKTKTEIENEVETDKIAHTFTNITVLDKTDINAVKASLYCSKCKKGISVVLTHVAKVNATTEATGNIEYYTVTVNGTTYYITADFNEFITLADTITPIIGE